MSAYCTCTDDDTACAYCEGRCGLAQHRADDFPALPASRLKLADSRAESGPLGWERYYNQTPTQRAWSMGQIVRDSMAFGEPDVKQFARGWLDALHVARRDQENPRRTAP